MLFLFMANTKVATAPIYAKRFDALRNMDAVAVDLLFDCM